VFFAAAPDSDSVQRARRARRQPYQRRQGLHTAQGTHLRASRHGFDQHQPACAIRLALRELHREVRAQTVSADDRAIVTLDVENRGEILAPDFHPCRAAPGRISVAAQVETQQVP
jgi:hypothetical protein